MTDQMPQLPVDDAVVPDQLPGDAAEQQPETSQGKPAYLTREEFETALREYDAQLRRQMQSQMDKRERRFQEKLAQYGRAVQVAKEAGQINDEQAAKLAELYRQQAIQDAVAETETEEAEAQQYDAALEAVNANGDFLYQQLGLMPGDPELVHVVTDGAPEEFIASILRAGQLKAIRLAGGNTPARIAARTPAQAPSGRTAPRNPIAQVNDSDALYNLADQEFRKQISGRP